MTEPIQIKSINHLLTIINNSENVREFFIQLNHGARSWKRITQINALDRYGRNKIEIINEIDDTRQVLTERNLNSDRYSNIANAIRNGAFYLFDGNENSNKSDIKYY